MIIPFIGGSGQGRSSNLDASRSINFMPEVASQDSKVAVALVGTPGTKTFVELPYGGPIRMSYTVGGRCFVVATNVLYEIYSDQFILPITYLDYSTGRIAVADNGVAALGVGGNQLCMIDNGVGYIFDFSTYTLTKITDIGFPTDAKQVAFLDGYFIVTNGTMNYFVSELYNGLVWPGLAFSGAVASADAIQMPVNSHQQLFLVKEYTTEVWYDAGIPTSQGSPFMRISGGVIDFGTPAPWSVVRGHNTMFFLANQRNGDAGEFVGVAMMNGNSPQLISTPSINYRISQFTTISDAWGYCYTDEGHMFYVLTFPTADATFVYDMTTQMWHERASYITEPYTQRRHVADTYTFFAGKHLVGHYDTNLLLEMSQQYYDDNGTDIVSIRTATPIWDKRELERMNITKLVLDAETGVGTGSVAPADLYYAWIADGSHYADGTGVPIVDPLTDVWPYASDAEYMAEWGTEHLWDDTAKAGGFNLVSDHNGNPRAWLSWSNDGGHTWSNEYAAGMGKMGEYHTRMIWRRLGDPRNRVFRLRMSDAVKKVIIGVCVNDGATA